METKILLIEDDLALARGLIFALEKQDYKVDSARTRAEAFERLRTGEYQLIILDVSLPDGNGYEICRAVRENSAVPVMFLTAADEETDVIMGLDIGADDYVTKPFKLAVLLSRIHALLRRSGAGEKSVLESAGLRMNLLQGTVFKGDAPLSVTAGEYKLLRLFMKNPKQVLSSEQILAALWDCDENFVDGNTLSVYIRRLRTKIEDVPSSPQKILTVRGLGYKWNA